LNIGFLRLVLSTDGTAEAVVTDSGPVIYNMKEVSTFAEQVGENTKYIIHPEEIMADNFAFAVLGHQDLPDQKIVDNIREILKK